MGFPVGSDVYFMHVYVPRPCHDKACFIGIMSLAWPDGDTRQAGIYLAMSSDGHSPGGSNQAPGIQI